MDAVERQVEAYNVGDVEAFVACYAQEVVFEDADGSPQTAGRDEMRKRYGELFASSSASTQRSTPGFESVRTSWTRNG